MVLDGEQDESFLVLDEERFFHFVIFVGLFLDLVVDDMFFPGEDGGVIFLSSAGTREFLLESRDGEVSFGTDVHF